MFYWWATWLCWSTSIKPAWSLIVRYQKTHNVLLWLLDFSSRYYTIKDIELRPWESYNNYSPNTVKILDQITIGDCWQLLYSDFFFSYKISILWILPEVNLLKRSVFRLHLISGRTIKGHRWRNFLLIPFIPFAERGLHTVVLQILLNDTLTVHQKSLKIWDYFWDKGNDVMGLKSRKQVGLDFYYKLGRKHSSDT